ncbi:rhodanese-related sulfurtransferase, phage shock protein [Mesoplasma florum L1]|uniref:Rhodanese-related sulfurtransferase, phage shock protein n=1 Tax=Mesoplasma florum (strain ATCC 33453 / NBRC 100688 / NCTC 11704 / L1) TaxID=265311 RepID=Q6F213_MESFL|nr:rhodanese-like domain-containing protein [Mesoplasma florum]AAT75460.1 rhodanese-related sulfurtransferase, phage shock protein [Mesoplasma florum L1]ATI73061.1 rhodanese-like domain-containing protein [Mesoplasma florum]AVN58717.1 rhodanese-like domain-containing protein [Mesoplasma florum]AVN61464.1 rhodanese-like domain-containing protein [Mesoplasma florum]AVN64851.1 rhodanese-like domain-containing protein [Mesoplasma florum]
MNNYEISKNEFYKLVDEGYIVIDVRSIGEDEMTGLSYKGSHNIPYPGVIKNAERLFPNKNEKMIIVCNYGSRSGLTAKTYRQMGYPNVFVLHGGLYELK